MSETARAIRALMNQRESRYQFDVETDEGMANQAALDDILMKTRGDDVKLVLALETLKKAADRGDLTADAAYQNLYAQTPGGTGSAFMRGLASGFSGSPNLWGGAKYLGQGENRIDLPTEQTGLAPYANAAGQIIGFMAPIVATGGAGLLGRAAWGAAGKLGGKTALGLLGTEVAARSGLQHYGDTSYTPTKLRRGAQEAGFTGEGATPMTEMERIQSAATSGALSGLSVPAGAVATKAVRMLPGSAGEYFRKGVDASFRGPEGWKWAAAQKAPGAIGGAAANIPQAQHDWDVMWTQQQQNEEVGQNPGLLNLLPMLALGAIGKPESAPIYARATAPTAQFGMKGPTFAQKLRGTLPTAAPVNPVVAQAGSQRERLGPLPEVLQDLYYGEGQLQPRTVEDADLFGAGQTRLAEAVPTRQELVEAAMQKSLLPERDQLEIVYGPDEVGKLLADIGRSKPLAGLRGEGQFLAEHPTRGVVQMRGNEVLALQRRGVLPGGQKVGLPPGMEPVHGDTGMGIRASVTMAEGQPAVTGILYGHDPQTGSAVILLDDGRVVKAPTSRVPEWQKYTVDAAAAREQKREQLAQRKKGVAPRLRSATDLPEFTPREGTQRIQSMADRAKANLGVWGVGGEEPQMAVSHDMATGVTGPTAVPMTQPELERLLSVLRRRTP